MLILYDLHYYINLDIQPKIHSNVKIIKVNIYLTL